MQLSNNATDVSTSDHYVKVQEIFQNVCRCQNVVKYLKPVSLLPAGLDLCKTSTFFSASLAPSQDMFHVCPVTFDFSLALEGCLVFCMSSC